MAIGRSISLMVALTAASCQSAAMFEIGIPEATPIAYADIQKASGVLGYAEPLLGPTFATKYSVPVGPGASLVDPATVAGAWELPLTTKIDALAQSLRARGSVDRVREFRDGQIWIADFSRVGQPPVRLMLIDGSNPTFNTSAVPEVRPGPHIYLIAYRKS